jgi:DNA polymerase-1
MGHILLLVDAFSLIYRAFFALPTLTGPDGSPVNAILGFTKMLRKLLTDHHPTHAAVVFDLGPPRQRLAQLPTYKAQRPPTPPELECQLPGIRDILTAMHIQIVEIEGVEADDIIATLATRAASAGHLALIASSDKDFLQLVSPRIRLLRPDPKTTTTTPIDPATVEARYGVRPDQIVDFLSLLGDASDNIPGAPGIGEKTAAELLRRFGTLDNLIAHAAELQKPTLRNAILGCADQLRANRQLIRLHTDLALPIEFESLKLQPPDNTALAAQFKKFGFKSLLAELDPASPAEPPDLFGPR